MDILIPVIIVAIMYYFSDDNKKKIKGTKNNKKTKFLGCLFIVGIVAFILKSCINSTNEEDRDFDEKMTYLDDCESRVKASLVHPSTYDKNDLRYIKVDDNHVNIVLIFTAKNSFNLELEHKAYCQYEGNLLKYFNIEEN